MSVATLARSAMLFTLTSALGLALVQPTAAHAATPTGTQPAVTTAAAGTQNSTGSYTVSKAVYAFLTKSVGVAVGPTPRLTGTAAGHTITIVTTAPTGIPVTLPTGVASPNFAGATIVIDTAANTLTLTSSATGSTRATLKIVIASAATSALAGTDLTASMSVTCALFGQSITLSGALSDVAGTAQVVLNGSLPADAALGQVVLLKGSSLTWSKATGLRMSGTATIGAGTVAAHQVAVSGSITAASTWSLSIKDRAGSNWAPQAGLVLAPAFAGTITDTAGTVRFDASAAVTGTWSPVAGETVSVGRAELADVTPPTGGPAGLAAGRTWLTVTGAVHGPAAATGTAIAVTDVAAKVTTLVSTQSGAVTLGTVPQPVTLSALKLTGPLSSPATGVAQVGIGSGADATVVQAKAALTASGALVLSFPTDLSWLDLGPAGVTGTAYWASAAVAAFPDPASGKTVSLPAGYSVIAASGNVSSGPSPTAATTTAAPTATASVPPAPTASAVTSTASATAPASGAPSTTVTSGQAPTTTTPTPPTGPGYPLSPAVQQFLTRIGVTVGATLTGTTSGTTLTVVAPAPTALPVQLPTGDTVTFGATTITVDTNTGTLTASSTATSGNGAAGVLAVSIAHSSTSALGADLSASLDLTGLPLFGATVELTGTLAYDGGTVTAALTGTLTSDAVVSPLLTIQSGSMLTLSTADGLKVNGTALVGTGAGTFTVAVAGSWKDLHTWSVSVSTAAGAPTFTPVDGLSLTPNFTGSITDDAGSVSFDVAVDEPVNWTAPSGLTLALNHVEVANTAPPQTLTCPGVATGDIRLDVTGTLTYAAAGIQAGAQACIDVPARTFSISGSETGTFGPSNGFTLSDAGLYILGDLKNHTATVSATAKLTVTAIASQPQFTVGFLFDSNGGFVAGTAVDASTLNIPGLGGELFVSSKPMKAFDPATIGIRSVTPFDLSAGVTVLTQYTPSPTIQAALSDLHLGTQNQVQLQANLSSSGFAMKIALAFGTRTGGTHLFSTGGADAYLDTVYLGFTASTQGVSFTIGGTGYLTLPPLDGGPSSAVAVALSGEIDLSPVRLKISFTLAGDCGTASCPWNPAFGINGLQVDQLSGSIGLDLTDPATPVPTLELAVSNLVLPDAWAKTVGLTSGAQISALLNLDVSQPELIFSISGINGQAALTPLAIASQDPTVVNSLSVDHASLVFAPLGGADVDNQPIAAGVSLVFKANIEGETVDVNAAVGIAPPSFSAMVNFGDLTVGSLVVHGTMLDITANTSGFSFAFSGGFTDSVSNISFAASVTLSASTSLAGGQITLSATGGLPSYISAGAAFSATLTGSGDAVTFTAYGRANLVINNTTVGQVSLTYSPATGALLAELNDSATVVANTFRNAYGAADYQTVGFLRSLQFNSYQIASGIAGSYHESAATIMEAFGNAGYSLDTLIQAAKAAVGASDTDVATAMQYFGYDSQHIASYLQTYFQDSQAQVYNALQAIGSGGQSVLDAISGFFNTGAYNIDTTFGLLLDVSGGSQNPGTPVLDYYYNGGGHNQQWYVLPTDSGWDELVNRNSGKCLSVDGNGDYNGAGLVQNPCTGSTSQQWSVGDPSGQHTLTNRASSDNGNGRVADITGQSLLPTQIELYDGNGGFNQHWNFVPAIG